MPNAEIKVLCNQLIEEVKLISGGVDDIAALEGGESTIVDRLKELSLSRLENVQQLVIALTASMTTDATAAPATDGEGEGDAGGEGQE